MLHRRNTRGPRVRPLLRVCGALAGVVSIVALVGCGPTIAPGPGGTISPFNDPNRFTYNDVASGYAAVDHAFAQWGPQVLACAQAYAERESHHHAGSANDSHWGLFQLDANKTGNLLAAAQTLNAPPSWYQPWVNAWAAMLVWHAHGNFSAWWFPRLPGC